MAAIVQLLERQVYDRKVLDSRCDSRTVNALYPHWGQAVGRLWRPSLTKDLQTEPQKVLSVVVLRQMHSVWFIRTDKDELSFKHCLFKNLSTEALLNLNTELAQIIPVV